MQDNRILQQSLEQELALLEELNGLSLLKKDAILKDDLETLETIVRKEEILSAKLKTISDGCLPQVQFFLQEKKLTAELNELVDKVRTTAIQFRFNNELNQGLIQDSLSVVQFTINSFRSLLNGGVTPSLYGSSGRVHQKQIHMLDVKG
jgi:flagellar biosynthesis/type III secretory pathway chaperone